MLAKWLDVMHASTRLDAHFYQDEYILATERVIRSGPTVTVQGVCSKQRPMCYGVLKPDFVDDGVPLVRNQDFVAPTINPKSMARITLQKHQEFRRSQLIAGDLLVTIGGYVGTAAIVPPELSGANINQHIARVAVDLTQCDPYYLWAFIESFTGGMILNRWVSGVAQPGINLTDLKHIPVPYPSTEIRRALGNIVRKSERLRELAEWEWMLARALLSRGLSTDLSQHSFEEFRETTLNSSGYRCEGLSPAMAWAAPSDEIAAQYFHPRRINAQLIAGQAGQCNRLADIAPRVRVVKSLPTYVGLDRIDSSTGVVSDHSNVDPGEDGAGPAFQAGDILFSRLRPYLNKVTIWMMEEAMGSGELLVYRVRGDSDPFYIFFVLKSPIGLYQVIDVTAGSTHPRVDEEVVDAIRIPRLGQEKEAQIGERVRSAFSMWYEAQALVPQARANVEALIDGTLDAERLLADGAAIDEWLAAHPCPCAPETS